MEWVYTIFIYYLYHIFLNLVLDTEFLVIK